MEWSVWDYSLIFLIAAFAWLIFALYTRRLRILPAQSGTIHLANPVPQLQDVLIDPDGGEHAIVKTDHLNWIVWIDMGGKDPLPIFNLNLDLEAPPELKMVTCLNPWDTGNRKIYKRLPLNEGERSRMHERGNQLHYAPNLGVPTPERALMERAVGDMRRVSDFQTVKKAGQEHAKTLREMAKLQESLTPSWMAGAMGLFRKKY